MKNIFTQKRRSQAGQQTILTTRSLGVPIPRPRAEFIDLNQISFSE